MTGSKRISGLLISLLLAAWGYANAAGLGRLSVHSALGQPLKAEIELLSVNRDELPGIVARLASREAFTQANIERLTSYNGLTFKVDQRPDGQPVVIVSSPSPMAEPFLDLLIELNWSSGRVIREYTILLDPPTGARQEAEAAPIVAPVASSRTPPAETVKPVEPAKPAAPPPARASETKPEPKPAKPVTESSAKPAPKPKSEPTSAASQYGPIKAGETLQGIARKLKPAEVSVDQMMVGLYQDNQEAFVGANINRLRKGQVLNVPDADAIKGIPEQEASKTVRGHADAWHAYRKKLADAPAELAQAKPADKAASGKVTAKDANKAPAPVAAPKDVLKLSKGEPVGVGKADPKAQAKVQAAEEDLTAKNRALAESRDRVNQLERTVKDMQKLLEMKAAPAPAPAPQLAPPPEAKPEAKPIAAPVQPAPAKPAAPAPAVKAPVPPPPPAPEATSWFTTFLNNPLYIGGLVAALLLSGLLWMMMVGSRRKQVLDKLEENISTGGELKGTSVFGNTPKASGPATQGSMLLTDFSRMGLGAIDTHEVDPIAEAEVYMAYGRDAQAEEILREAFSKDPNRHELALKLLEIYASRKDRMAFETTASELYASLGGENTQTWQRAAEMGRSIDPDNPLYRSGMNDIPVRSVAAAKPESAFKPGDDFDLPLKGAGAAFAGNDEAASVFDLSALESLDPNETLIPQPTPSLAADLGKDDLDFSFPEPEPAASAQDDTLDFTLPDQPVSPPASLDFDFPASPQTQPDPKMDEADEPAPEFNLDSLAEQDLTLPVTPMDTPRLDLSGIDLELAQPEGAETESEPGVMDLSALDLAAPDETPAPDAFNLDFEPTPAAGGFEFNPPAEQPEASAPEELPSPAESEIDPALREEVETKLDLARAYLEMGDKEGAREILEEVLSEGDSGQKANAEKLLAEA